jgi:hypothetical protein
LVFYRDSDEDGFGDKTVIIMACSQPSGYTDDQNDCNDADFMINPYATEACNAFDDNCNSLTDEGVQTVYYNDADSDGYGDMAVSIIACLAPPGFVLDKSDCNDVPGWSAVHPGAIESCNGIDDNCNSMVDESPSTIYYADADGDGYGSMIDSLIGGCNEPAGYTVTHSDCDDNNSNTHIFSIFYLDEDSDGYGNMEEAISICSGMAPAGYAANSQDCDDGHAVVNPATSEICNGVDDNCNGQIDEGVKFTFYADADGDGFGTIGNATLACSPPSGFVTDHTD